MLQKTMVKDDGDGAAAAEEETDQAAESNIAQDLPQAGFSDVVLEEQDPVAERSKRQRVRSMLHIASSGTPENEFDDNDGLLARTFPWVLMFEKVGMPPIIRSFKCNYTELDLTLQAFRNKRADPHLSPA
jgi:hypothetical protein